MMRLSPQRTVQSSRNRLGMIQVHLRSIDDLGQEMLENLAADVHVEN